MNRELDKTINRTPNPDCPACQEQKQKGRLHAAAEWKKFHGEARKR